MWYISIMEIVLSICLGIGLSAAVFVEMSPLAQWTLAVILGGGAAGTVQGATVMMRSASTVTTGGLGNPAVSTGETAGATAMSLAAILVPVLAVALVLLFVVMVVRWIRRRRRSTASAP